ncbi:MAG: hypothetical protein U1F27_01635 [Turneriella sp.]
MRTRNTGTPALRARLQRVGFDIAHQRGRLVQAAQHLAAQPACVHEYAGLVDRHIREHKAVQDEDSGRKKRIAQKQFSAGPHCREIYPYGHIVHLGEKRAAFDIAAFSLSFDEGEQVMHRRFPFDDEISNGVNQWVADAFMAGDQLSV